MIRLFVGTDHYQSTAERAFTEAVRRNTTTPVSVCWMRQGDPAWSWGGLDYGWATPFSMYRWYVPELCGHEGRAIYMDTDMLALADLTELWEWPLPPDSPGAYAGRMHTKADVILWQCQNVPAWPREAYHGRHSQTRKEAGALLHRSKLPDRWDHIDKLHQDTAILHLSKLSCQPWKPYPRDKRKFDTYKPHPDPAAEALFWEYAS